MPSPRRENLSRSRGIDTLRSGHLKWFQIYISRSCHSVVRNLCFIHVCASKGPQNVCFCLFANLIHLISFFHSSSFLTLCFSFSLLYILRKGHISQLYAKKPQNMLIYSTVYVFISYGFQKNMLFIIFYENDVGTNLFQDALGVCCINLLL